MQRQLFLRGFWEGARRTPPSYGNGLFIDSSLDEGLEEAAHGGLLLKPLWMPLDGQTERMAGKLYRFYKAIGGTSCNFETFPQAVDALVVQAVHLRHGLPQDSRQPAAGIYGNRVGKIVAGDGWKVIVLEGGWAVGLNIRVKCAAQGNIDDLEAAADSEEGRPTLNDEPSESQFKMVPVFINLVGQVERI